MRINIISIESSRPEWTQEAFNSYKTKFNKSIDVIWVGCKPAQRSKNYKKMGIFMKKKLYNSSVKMIKNFFQTDL